MNPILYKLTSVIIFLVVCIYAFSQDKCYTYQNYLHQIENDPSNSQKIQDFEKRLVQQSVIIEESNEDQLYIIPVVVHIVLRNPNSVTDAQVVSQIVALNRDYRNKNSEAVQAEFLPVDTDTRIEFRLANIDPFGSSTFGITRTVTNVNKFIPIYEDVKYSIRGGKDIWDPNKYLNIWVCDLEDERHNDNVLGYAQFPEVGQWTTDGVVIDYKAFGTTGDLLYQNKLGRTAVHEVGHWLGLKHIWGDDGNECDISNGQDWPGCDLCDDTPDQAGQNYNCPSYPLANICDQNHSVMFMNYMDYVNDECMFMFTKDQKTRMRATLNTSRELLSSSGGYTNVFDLAISISSNPKNVWVGNNTGVKFTAISRNGEGRITWRWTVFKIPNDFSGICTNCETEDGVSENKTYTTSKSFTFQEAGNYLIHLHAYDELHNIADIDYSLIVETGNPCILSQFLMTDCATQYVYSKGSHLKLEDCSGIYTNSSCNNPWGAQLDQIAQVDWLKNGNRVDQIVYNNSLGYFVDPNCSGICPENFGCINLDAAGEFDIIHKAYAGYIDPYSSYLTLIPDAYNTMTKKIKVIDCDNIQNITTKTGLNSFHGKIEKGYIYIQPAGNIDINSGETHVLIANREILLKQGLNIKAGSNFTAKWNKCPEVTCDCNLTKSTKSNLIPEPNADLNNGDLDVNIYPNPAHSLINIEILGEFNGSYKIELINDLGVVMKVHDTSDLSTQLSIEELSSGLYILKVFIMDKILVKKIQKN